MRPCEAFGQRAKDHSHSQMSNRCQNGASMGCGITIILSLAFATDTELNGLRDKLVDAKYGRLNVVSFVKAVQSLGEQSNEAELLCIAKSNHLYNFVAARETIRICKLERATEIVSQFGAGGPCWEESLGELCRRSPRDGAGLLEKTLSSHGSPGIHASCYRILIYNKIAGFERFAKADLARDDAVVIPNSPILGLGGIASEYLRLDFTDAP